MTGLCIAFLVFIILVLVGGMIQEALSNRITGSLSINPLLPLILIVIAFVGAFIGTIIVSGVYNLIFTDKYYDMGKMFNVSLILNVMIFVLFIPLYVVFAGNIDQLFIILAFHILFAVFSSYCAIEFTTNPNYCGSHLIGTMAGLTVSLLIFAIVYKVINVQSGNSANFLLALPPMLAYTFIPLCHGLWEKIYYRFYLAGNNFFYIPSLSEVLVDSTESDDVLVETDV